MAEVDGLTPELMLCEITYFLGNLTFAIDQMISEGAQDPNILMQRLAQVRDFTEATCERAYAMTHRRATSPVEWKTSTAVSMLETGKPQVA